MYSKLINDVLRNVINNKKELFNALIIPLLLLMAIEYTISNTFIFNARTNSYIFTSNTEEYIFYFFILVSFFINVSIAVNVHRILLLNENIEIKNSFKIGNKELGFILKTIMIVLLLALVFAIVLGVSFVLSQLFSFKPLIFVGIFIASILSLILFSRLSLILPAVSVGDESDFNDALDLSKDNKFLVVFMVSIFPAIISIFTLIVYSLLINFLVVVVSEYFKILYPLLNLFITVLVISCLSTVYMFLKEKDK